MEFIFDEATLASYEVKYRAFVVALGTITVFMIGLVIFFEDVVTMPQIIIASITMAVFLYLMCVRGVPKRRLKISIDDTYLTLESEKKIKCKVSVADSKFKVISATGSGIDEISLEISYENDQGKSVKCPQTLYGYKWSVIYDLVWVIQYIQTSQNKLDVEVIYGALQVEKKEMMRKIESGTLEKVRVIS